MYYFDRENGVYVDDGPHDGEYRQLSDGLWYRWNDPIGEWEEEYDEELIAEMEYLQGACPFCGERHEGDCYDEYPDY